MRRLQSVPQENAFIRWRQTVNDGKKPTLCQAFELAVDLYAEAFSLPKTTLPTAKYLVHLVERTPFQNKNLASWQGIQVGWFVSVFCASPYLRRLQSFGCEAWFVRKVGVVVMIVMVAHSTGQKVAAGALVEQVPAISQAWGLECDAEKVIRKPNTFVSYTGAYSWDHVVETLRQLDPDDVIWLDISGVNQFSWAGCRRASSTSEQQETKCRKEFMNELVNLIREIGQTALLLEKWHNVMTTLGQIWVLFEIFTTAALATAKLRVLFAPHEVRNLDTALYGGHGEHVGRARWLLRTLRQIDVNQAKAGDDGDRRAILERMREHGLMQVNVKVRTVMLDWLTKQCRQGIEHVRHLIECGPIREPQRRQEMQTALHCNMAFLLHEQGRTTEAVLTFSAALRLSATPTFISRKNLLRFASCRAEELLSLGKLDEEESLLRDVLAIQGERWENDHCNTLLVVGTMAVPLHKHGYVQKAEARYRMAWEGRCHRLITNPEEFDQWAESTNHLASVLYSQGKLRESEALLWAIVDGVRLRRLLRSACTMSNFFTCLHNLATLLCDQGRLEAAEPLLWAALDGRQWFWGDAHADTLATTASLALVLHQRHCRGVSSWTCPPKDLRRIFDELPAWLRSRLLRTTPIGPPSLAHFNRGFRYWEKHAKLLFLYMRRRGRNPRHLFKTQLTGECAVAVARRKLVTRFWRDRFLLQSHIS